MTFQNLEIAIRRGNITEVRRELDAGTPDDGALSRGMVVAAMEGRVDIVKLLLGKGANVNSTDATG